VFERPGFAGDLKKFRTRPSTDALKQTTTLNVKGDNHSPSLFFFAKQQGDEAGSK
jgi:hypothetical protein